MCRFVLHVSLLASLLLLMLPCRGLAEDEGNCRLLLLHTNDLHARLRCNDSGEGGLPYLSAYVATQRQQRADILLVDAGDVLEKGNMVSWLTRGRIMYEAMHRIGFQASVLGNHDFAFGNEQLVVNSQAAQFPLLCANAPTGHMSFPAAAIVDVHGVRVGIVGMTLFATSDLDAHAAILARETKQINNQTDLQLALCHVNSQTCLKLAEQVPQIDVFVSGHSHEVLAQPKRAESSGAWILQAGSLARYVGRWELTVNKTRKEVVGCEGQLVPLTPATVAADNEMIHWIRQQEESVCPQAERVVGNADSSIKGTALAKLYASSFLHATGADAAICGTALLRENIYPGPICLDDLFLTYVPGNRRQLVEASLTATEVETLQAAASQGKYAIAWRQASPPLAAQHCRVVMTQGDWEALRKLPRLNEVQAAKPLETSSLTDILADYLSASR